MQKTHLIFLLIGAGMRELGKAVSSFTAGSMLRPLYLAVQD